MTATYTSTLSNTQLAHPKHKQQQQQLAQPSSSTTLKNDRPQNVNGNDASSSQNDVVAAQNGHIDVEEDEDDAFDLGEGTSAAGPGFIARLNRDIARDFPDIASLLKDPLIFVPARFGDDASQKVPYEPLPSGPQKPMLNGKADQTFPKTPGVAVPLTGLSPDQAVSSSPGIGKGKAAANGQNASAIAGPSSVPLPMNWPQAYPVGPGYNNLGNTCFLNSTLQALTHTPPLVACLMGDMHHSAAKCKVAATRRYCLLCAMQKHIQFCFRRGRPLGAMEPSQIVRNLTTIARGMRIGRQEDAHEFLRFGIDHMQEAAAKNLNPPAKTDSEKENTFMARIFGGKLRSRVACSSCKQNSDTFDSFMDLSLDVSRSLSVREALQTFIREDVLQGANKYKCEKCKKLVNARKHFTIEKAPQILHIHLKRFTPTGKKISGAIGYPETLHLGDYMSAGTADRDPTYRLYAVVSHSGSGPHSGHYFAHVRSGQNHWYEMNDSMVREVQPHQALGQRNAYMLFYERTNRLGDAVGKGKPQGVANGMPQLPASSPSGNALGKRKDREDTDASQPFPAQKVKYNNQPGPKTPYQQERQNNGSSAPYQQPSPISLNRNQHHHRNGGGQKKANNYFANRNHNNNGNRPRMVSNMTGRPRN